MPFTFAHPAAVLPFIRWRWLSATGLIFGSITPDFEYFFQMRMGSEISHTLPGLFIFDLPVAMLLMWIYLRWVHKPLTENLPAFFRDRVQALPPPRPVFGGFRETLIVALSILIGAATHIFWDSFTHSGSATFWNWPWLSQQMNFGVMTLSVFRVMQHGGTLIGLVILYGRIHKLPRPVISRHQITPFWIRSLLLCLIIVTIRMMIDWTDDRKDWIVSFISGGMIGLIVMSIRTRMTDP